MERIGKYQVLNAAITTTYARIYYCSDPDLRVPVAIKLFSPHPASEGLSPGQWKARFEAEARALAMFDHPHIIAVKAFDYLDGQPYLVMPYQAANLSFEIGKDDPFHPDKQQRPRKSTPERGLQILGQVASAAAAMHRKGLVHRVIRPSNILLSAKDRGRAKLADFSFVKTGEKGVALPDHWIGPSDYCPPEQLENASQVGAEADVYALGVLAYRVLTGVHPDHGNAPLLLTDMPQSLIDLVALATDPDPARRPTHAGMFLEQLAAIKVERTSPVLKVVSVKRLASQ